MKDADKNRDPEAAIKRARSDARCALRKLGLLRKLERWEDIRGLIGSGACEQEALKIVDELAKALA